MKEFKEFLMQGSLVQLATAVIIGAAFGDVVKAFTQIIMDFIGLIGGQPDFSQVVIPGINVNIGVFLTALVSFVIIAAVVFFGVIKPYNALQARMKKNKEAEVAVEAPTTDELLAEIRDLLKARN
ncbi:large conductance mechanosensitive channel protein MscL [Propioniciclava coleopterorum]|uniref:Large conductance mechanosensitive channel protein MscL n=1 Tax=Propioniciclava coleopterorum TaxID=2714937 RepID=A0A6G7Y4X0_9ACTN|nr:large conductance mechanosensitive channel protein MscL [Propioniciclava coleopterorum]QIK71667.1 large conductance mechanosensitive channel protein MscL [Propioniciclava coleopterorum]